jgi:hypothetical protein
MQPGFDIDTIFILFLILKPIVNRLSGCIIIRYSTLQLNAPLTDEPFKLKLSTLGAETSLGRRGSLFLRIMRADKRCRLVTSSASLRTVSAPFVATLSNPFSMLPMHTSLCLARVRATFKRRWSDKKPIVCLPVRTKDIMTKFASHPWEESTVETVTSPRPAALSRREIKST